MTPTLRRHLPRLALLATIGASIATSQPMWAASDTAVIADLSFDAEQRAVGLTAVLTRNAPRQVRDVALSLELLGTSRSPVSTYVAVYAVPEPWDGAVDGNARPLLGDDAVFVSDGLIRGILDDEAESTQLYLPGEGFEDGQSTVHLVVVFEDGDPDFAGRLEVTADTYSADPIRDDALSLGLMVDAGPGRVLGGSAAEVTH